MWFALFLCFFFVFSHLNRFVFFCFIYSLTNACSFPMRARNGKLFATIFIPLIKIKNFIIIICVLGLSISLCHSFYVCVVCTFEIIDVNLCACCRWADLFLRFSFHSSNWTSMNQSGKFRFVTQNNDYILDMCIVQTETASISSKNINTSKLWRT